MRRQNGVVALITTMIVSILLMLILISLVTLMSGELHQSADADQSVRAFFAAEAGIERGVLAVRAGLSTNQDCGDAGSTYAVGSATITCQRITLNSTNLSPTLPLNQAYELIIPGSAAFTRVQLNWNLHNSTQDSANLNAQVPFRDAGGVKGAGFVPQFGSSPWTFPSVLEVSMIDFPASFNSGLACGAGVQAPDSSHVCRRNWVFVPGYKAGTSSPSMTPAKQTVDCDEANAIYDCQASIDLGASGNTRIIRIIPRYRGTSLNLQFYNNGALVAVPTNTAVIDVTAKAGDDVYRRVVAEIPVKPTLASGLDYVLFSNNDITKDCSVSLGEISGGGCN